MLKAATYCLDTFVCGLQSVGEYLFVATRPKKAVDTTHPFDAPVRVPSHVACILFKFATEGSEAIVADRCKTLSRLKERRDKLQCKEDSLHQALHPEVAEVVRGKRILLFKELLEEIQYDDLGVVELMVQGVKLVGEMDEVGIWKKSEEKRAKCSIEQVWANATET